MTATTATQPTTHTIDAPGARITYDVRPNDATIEPPLLLFGSPMGAGGFVTLASHFSDRTVVTYDPRGAERSKRNDDAAESTPEEHADDLHRVIQALGGGPVDVFANSGGAVNALAWVARHPEDVRILIAHEPPSASVLPDREAAVAACRDLHETYLKRGFGPAMAKFIALVMFQGPIPHDYLDRPAPDPAMFGLPTQDDGSRDDPLVGQNMPSCPAYVPDFDALRRAPTRIVLAVGEASGETMAARAARTIAQKLGLEAAVFPGDHAGFLGGEYGQTGEPDAFAAKLREVLSAAA
ncbi:MAG TPA: alpha/beta hydrolase [Candidatus Limnocylindrales bacterium]|nr:alpha/beta hydrolase [Candidatus Limnocylindrales bacterium]